MRRWLAALVLVAAMEAPVNADEQCELVRVNEGGALVVRLHGAEQPIAIFGITVPQPKMALYGEILERLPHASRTLRCTVRAPGPPPRANFHYLAWHDKSGDVWQD